MPYLLGIDIGTSGAKALMCDARGDVLATATAEYPLYSPQPQWSEQHPADWWAGAQTALRNVIAQAGIEASEIVGLGWAARVRAHELYPRGGADPPYAREGSDHLDVHLGGVAGARVHDPRRAAQVE